MRKFITKSLELFCQIAIVLIIAAATISGGDTGGLGGAIVGFVGGLIVSIVAFGALFLLMDIADNTRKTAEILETRNP